MRTVLGNHDLHLLAVAHGHGRLKRGDTLDDILNHPERRTLLDWLRAWPADTEQQRICAGARRPAAAMEHRTGAHAGRRSGARLRHRPDAYFAHMYGNKPRAWSAQLVVMTGCV